MVTRKRRIAQFAAICAGVALFALAPSAPYFLADPKENRLWKYTYKLATEPAEKIELAFGDLIAGWGRHAPERSDIVFLGIDDASLNILDVLGEDQIAQSEALELISFGYPYPREVWAMAMGRIVEAGAHAVVFDIVFPKPGKGDAQLKAALEKYRDRAVVGIDLSKLSHGGGSGLTKSLTSIPPSILEPDSPADPRLGVVNFDADVDGKVRAARYSWRLHPALDPYNSLAAAALRQSRDGAFIPAGERAFRFRYPESLPGGAYPPISFYRLFEPRDWETLFKSGEALRGKIVVVGSSANLLHDVVQTPQGTIHGPQAHICAIAAALGGDFYRRASVWEHVFLIFLMALLAFCAALLFRRPVVGLAVLLGLAALYPLGALTLYNFRNILATGAAPLGVLLGSGLLCFGLQFAGDRLEKARFRRELERFLSPSLADVILRRPEGYYDSLGGVRKQVAILFSDVRGFTAASEKADPKEQVAQLNEYFAEMVDAVLDRGGMVDKFMGDGMMAYWGNIHVEGEEADPAAAKEAATSAILSALDMRPRLAKLNARWATEGRQEFRIGIGLNFGVALFGNVGSERKKDPTLIGDAVNLASRLEGLTKKFASDIVVSESVAGWLDGNPEILLRPLCAVGVVGKSEPVVIYAADSPGQLSESGRAWIDDYNRAIELYQGGDLEAADAVLEECAREKPSDPAVEIHLERIAEGIAFSEPLRMTSK